MFVDIPHERVAVFSNDGRVFYDLGDLIEQFEAVVIQHETIAPIFGREDEAKGERTLIDAIKKSYEILSLEASVDISVDKDSTEG